LQLVPSTYVVLSLCDANVKQSLCGHHTLLYAHPPPQTHAAQRTTAHTTPASTAAPPTYEPSAAAL
jgi:hypothetical protein